MSSDREESRYRRKENLFLQKKKVETDFIAQPGSVVLTKKVFYWGGGKRKKGEGGARTRLPLSVCR